jgi:hypothetical protein
MFVEQRCGTHRCICRRDLERKRTEFGVAATHHYNRPVTTGGDNHHHRAAHRHRCGGASGELLRPTRRRHTSE